MKTIIEVIKKFNTTEKCIRYLEQARWKDGIYCPFCNSDKTSHKTEKSMRNRQQCGKCKKSFSVTSGTIFDNARKLPEWFQILALMLNARKSLSSYQISRDLGLRQGTAWKIQNKIRKAMQTGESELLKGIIEMDETYIGGKPGFNELSKPGRGSDKLPVVGMIERGGNVKTQVIPEKDKTLNFKTLESIVKKNIDTVKSVLITDDFKSYRPMKNLVLAHPVINHSQGYVREKVIHTNTIEGFWSLLKRAWYGSHHHYSKDNAHLYVGETAYKANNRKNKDVFVDTIRRMLG